MTERETVQILAILRAAYPAFYGKQGDADVTAAVNLWQTCFADEPYELVSAAVTALIKTRTSTFPPAVGEVTEQIRLIARLDELTAMEAWALVSDALRGSAYDSKRLFDGLHPAVQRVVGSPSQLHEWALMDATTVQSVISSNFQRSFNTIAARQRQQEALPPAVREYMERMSGGSVIKQLEG